MTHNPIPIYEVTGYTLSTKLEKPNIETNIATAKITPELMATGTFFQ